MLRQALVDAEAAAVAQQQQQHAPPLDTAHPDDSIVTNEQTSLTKKSQQQQHDTEYGAVTTHSMASEVPESSVQSGSYVEDYDDDEDDDDDDDEEEEEEEEPTLSLFEKIWNGLKTLVRVVANVENLWDSPPPPPPSSSSSYSYYRYESIRNRQRRNQYIVLFWFVVLASSYAGERSTFKLLVDRAGPFRLFSVQVITVSHILLCGGGLLISYYTKRHYNQQVHRSSGNGPIFMPLGIPLVDCILMAVLDTITMVMVFLTGAHVPPTLTVILVQFTIPLTAFLTQIIHPDGKFKCGRNHHHHHQHDNSPFDNDNHTSNTHNDNHNNSSTDDNGYHEPNTILMNGRVYEKDHHNFLIHSFDNQQQQRQQQLSLPANHRTNHTIPAAPPILPTTTVNNDERLPGWGGLAAAHVWGSLILFLAVSLALFPAFYSIAHPDFFIYADAIPTRTAINTIGFVMSCFPAAASQLYKEHIFLQYRQPVNMGYLNLILSIFQLILVSVLSPAAYGLQGLGFRGDWFKLYPPSRTSDNFVDGLKCFFGFLDEDDQENKYPEDAECRLTLLLALLYVFSIIAVGVSVDKIVNAGATKVMYRGISAGIIVAVLSMHYYDMHITDFSYGPAVDALNLVCLLLLVLGAEVYHRSSLQESTFETVYPVVMMPTFDD